MKNATTEQPEALESRETSDMLERLLTHKTLCVAPREELLWLVRRGRLRRLAKGDVGLAQGSDSAGMGMWAILSGRMAIFVDRGAS